MLGAISYKMYSKNKDTLIHHTNIQFRTLIQICRENSDQNIFQHIDTYPPCSHQILKKLNSLTTFTQKEKDSVIAKYVFPTTIKHQTFMMIPTFPGTRVNVFAHLYCHQSEYIIWSSKIHSQPVIEDQWLVPICTDITHFIIALLWEKSIIVKKNQTIHYECNKINDIAYGRLTINDIEISFARCVYFITL